jgi:hypothetical protein
MGAACRDNMSMLFKRRKEKPVPPTEETPDQPVLLDRIGEYTKPSADDWLFNTVEPTDPQKPTPRNTRSRRTRRRSTSRGPKPAPHPA